MYVLYCTTSLYYSVHIEHLHPLPRLPLHFSGSLGIFPHSKSKSTHHRHGPSTTTSTSTTGTATRIQGSCIRTALLQHPLFPFHHESITSPIYRTFFAQYCFLRASRDPTTKTRLLELPPVSAVSLSISSLPKSRQSTGCAPQHNPTARSLYSRHRTVPHRIELELGLEFEVLYCVEHHRRSTRLHIASNEVIILSSETANSIETVSALQASSTEASRLQVLP